MSQRYTEVPEGADLGPDSRADTPQPYLRHGCGRCGSRWAGLSAAHCGSCHSTFSSVTGFDRHRKGGECVEPVSVGLVWKERPGYAVWAQPGGGEEAVRRLRKERTV